jgi:NAD(P)-dependent dehydrogenase (short-subunit alcohol dehydrogenase family)
MTAMTATELGVLRGRRVLVTGGGRGIGKEIALAFVSAGARVAVAARTHSEVTAVARSCGEGSLAIVLDVTDEQACTGAVEQVATAFGGIDVLVNNAGIAGSTKFTNLSTDVWRRTFAVDLDGPFFLTRAAVPFMLEQGGGSVISIASTAARAGAAYISAYAAAKHGLLGLMRSLAVEYAARNVTFNCVCPAYVDSPMTEQTVQAIVARTGVTHEVALGYLVTPQGRLIDASEVAALCVLLASPGGRSINGQAIVIDGGRLQA